MNNDKISYVAFFLYDGSFLYTQGDTGTAPLAEKAAPCVVLAFWPQTCQRPEPHRASGHRRNSLGGFYSTAVSVVVGKRER
jgi:hypothetical protein